MTSRIWDRPRSSAVQWDVVLTDDESLHPDLAESDGVCDTSLNTIFINTRCVRPDGWAKVRAHEEIHLVAGNGPRLAIRLYLKALGLELTDEQMDDLEELFAETYGLGWFVYLSDNGYLRYPQL